MTNPKPVHQAHTFTEEPKENEPLKFKISNAIPDAYQQFEQSCIKEKVSTILNMVALSPNTLQQVVKPFKIEEEQLMVFVASIVAFGPLMPKVHFNYDSRETYPMLMLFITAPPSSGKGVLKFPQRLPQLVQKELLEVSNQLNINYKIDLKEAQRQRKRGNMVPLPEEPKAPILVVPGNISSAALNEILAKNGDDNSILLFELEADAFGITSAKQEFGNMNSTILRSLFHSECISVRRKTDNQHFEVNNPKGAVIFSGTISQVRSIFQSNQDGLFSRFTFISVDGSYGWKNVFPDEKETFDDYFLELSKIYYNCWTYLKNRSVEVRFTEEQESRLNSWGKVHLANTHSFMGEYANSIPKRHVNMLARFATIICMIRYFEKKETESLVYCSNHDVDIAEWIVDISIFNALAIFKTLPGERITGDNLKKTSFWQNLDITFTTADFQRIGRELTIPTKTQYNWIHGFIKTGLLSRVNTGEYKKTSLAEMAMA